MKTLNLQRSRHRTSFDPNVNWLTRISTSNTTSVNTIKDMLAGLPEFQKGKEAYSLHLTMAQECMKVFQDHKLTDLASVEQVFLTPKFPTEGLNLTITVVIGYRLR
jgi:hypothetical protein